MTLSKNALPKRNLAFLYYINALVICLVLNIGILKDYIFLDANEYLYTATRNPNFHDEFIQGGRPLLGYWCEFIYGYLCNTVADLKWLRLFALVVSVLFSTQLFCFLLKLKLKVFEAAIFSILVLSLPSFTVYFSWSATAEIPILLILNFYSGQLLLKALNKKGLLNYIIPFTIVLASLLVYQSVVMVFLLPFVFTVIINKEIDFKKPFYIILFTLVCFIFYYALFKTLLNISDLEATNRSSLALLDLPKKIIKFHGIELITLLKGSGFLILSIVSFIIGFIAFIGFFSTLQRKTKEHFVHVILLAAFLIFSYAPNILSGQSYFSLRTIAPTAILVLFYQFYYIIQVSKKKPIAKKLLLTIPISLLIFSAYNSKYYITDIQSREYEVVKNAFLEIDINKTKQITVIRPEYGFLQKNRVLKNGFSGEFGNLSSVKDWATPHLFCQVTWEASESTDKATEIFSPKNITVLTKEKDNYPEGTTVINLVEIFKKAFVKN